MGPATRLNGCARCVIRTRFATRRLGLGRLWRHILLLLRAPGYKMRGRSFHGTAVPTSTQNARLPPQAGCAPLKQSMEFETWQLQNRPQPRRRPPPSAHPTPRS
uniref:Uncharacterized protein n=1 Tax=mine drainage metagenome TaxID=410659 RepID=E6PUN9_9ZZZZ